MVRYTGKVANVTPALKKKTVSPATYGIGFRSGGTGVSAWARASGGL